MTLYTEDEYVRRIGSVTINSMAIEYRAVPRSVCDILLSSSKIDPLRCEDRRLHSPLSLPIELEGNFERYINASVASALSSIEQFASDHLLNLSSPWHRVARCDLCTKKIPRVSQRAAAAKPWPMYNKTDTARYNRNCSRPIKTNFKIREHHKSPIVKILGTRRAISLVCDEVLIQ